MKSEFLILFRALFFSQRLIALRSMSTPITVAYGSALARARAMHPDPAPMSRMVSRLFFSGSSLLMSHEHHSSVSGLGIKIGGSTEICMPQKGTVPRMY